MNKAKANALRALSSLNYAICASLDLSVHGMGWNEAQCVSYLASFGITDTTQIHQALSAASGRARQLSEILPWLPGDLQTKRERSRTLFQLVFI